MNIDCPEWWGMTRESRVMFTLYHILAIFPREIYVQVTTSCTYRNGKKKSELYFTGMNEGKWLETKHIGSDTYLNSDVTFLLFQYRKLTIIYL